MKSKTSPMKSSLSFMQNNVVPTLAALSLTASSTFAANIWDGGAGTGNWNDAANWDNNTVPANAQALHFAGSIH